MEVTSQILFEYPDNLKFLKFENFTMPMPMPMPMPMLMPTC